MNPINPPNQSPMVFGGSAGRHLSGDVCRKLGIPEGRLQIQHFSDGETGIKILDNVRGADCYLVQGTCTPVNDNLMELLLCVDAFMRASAERVNVIVPYFGYARQDRKDQGRVALSAKLVANMITAAGADRVVCLDLHSAQIQGFFDIPVDHLYAAPVLLEYIRKQPWGNGIVVVSPDVGNVKRCRGYASRLNAPLAIIDKRRPAANVSEVMNIIGEVSGRHCLLIDDLIDTAGTLCNASVALRDAGALSITACATHPVLSGNACARLENSPIERVIITNSIPQDGCKSLSKLEIVNVAPMIAEAIHRIHNFLSVSALFD
jgi:ribose-phosphate pyrophosphokinase